MILDKLREKVLEAAKAAGYNELVVFDITAPPKGANADYATNIALVIANSLKINPKEVAEKIAEMIKTQRIPFPEGRSLDRSGDEMMKDALVAGPGFINIVLNEEYYFAELGKILEQGKDYGRSVIGSHRSVNVEYISANPTGPLHIGNARSGPIGEMIANLFEFFGYKVEREFYVNDIGGQVNHLAETIYYWYEKSNGIDVELPENCYPGEYMQTISTEIFTESKDRLGEFKNKEEFLEFFKSEGLKKLISMIKSDVELLDIKFDKWFYQSELETNDSAEEVIGELTEKGFTASKEGALWFKNPNDPDLNDKESVLRKSDDEKTLTYFADDIAYHRQKIDRGNEVVVDVWGSNHHGHIPRLIAAMKALGYREEQIKVILYQYVRLKNGDEITKMGKRLGNFVTLRQVIEAGVSAEAFKYFVIAQNSNTPIDFDVKLASERSEKNPVFYIEYAHARICSILRKSEEEGIISSDCHPERSEGSRDSSDIPQNDNKDGATLDRHPERSEGSQEGIAEGKVDFALLKEEVELQLIHELAKFPDILADIMKDFQIQLLPHYIYKIAGMFHEFYTNCIVLSDDKNLTLARLELIKATKIIIASSLAICDIEAPEKM